MEHKLFILISTIDDRIGGVFGILQPYDKRIVYVVSHQITTSPDTSTRGIVSELSARPDVRYLALEGRGVAKNRNNALGAVDADSLCLILDDDVKLCRGAFETVRQAFVHHPEADFISFKILDMEGKDYKNYPQQQRWHTISTLTGIGTTEMAFRSNAVIKNGVLFDDAFGPGAEKYPVGEDYIFAMDLYHHGVRMLFCPKAIVQHPSQSTGGRLDKEIIFGRGAVFARVFGWWAPAVDFYFAVKKHAAYRTHYSFARYLKLMLSGSIDFLRNKT